MDTDKTIEKIERLVNTAVTRLESASRTTRIEIIQGSIKIVVEKDYRIIK